MNDYFTAIHAQLEAINGQIERKNTEQWGLINGMMTALEEIAAIKSDDHGNGLRLAIEIASRAIDEASSHL